MDKLHPSCTPMVIRSLDVDKDSFSSQENDMELLDLDVPYLSVIKSLMYLANYTWPNCKFWNGWNAKKGEVLNWLVKKYGDFWKPKIIFNWINLITKYGCTHSWTRHFQSIKHRVSRLISLNICNTDIINWLNHKNSWLKY